MGIETGNDTARRLVRITVLAALTSALLVVAIAATTAGAAVVHGSASNDNACTATFAPAVMLPGSATVPVTVSTDASPQPQDGGPITLSNTQLSASVPGVLLQTPADLGLIGNGASIPMSGSLRLAGWNTVEATNVAAVSAVATLQVVGGVVQPITVSLTVPDTTWSALDPASPVQFTEQSLQLVWNLSFSGMSRPVTMTLDCAPTTMHVIVALDGVPPTTTTTAPPTTTTTQAPTTTTTAPPTTTTTQAPPTTSPSSGPCDRPGKGHGDKNHTHCGSQGKERADERRNDDNVEKHHGHGKHRGHGHGKHHGHKAK
jgi:hypothetical protein